MDVKVALSGCKCWRPQIQNKAHISCFYEVFILHTFVRHLGYSWSPGRTLKEMGTRSALRLAQNASQMARCTALQTTSRPVKATKAMGLQQSSGGRSHCVGLIMTISSGQDCERDDSLRVFHFHLRVFHILSFRFLSANPYFKLINQSARLLMQTPRVTVRWVNGRDHSGENLLDLSKVMDQLKLQQHTRFKLVHYVQLNGAVQHIKRTQ